MKVVIVEDEVHTARNLAKNIKLLRSDANILEIIDSVEQAIEFFSGNPDIDLIFMDIQLSDGISFDIFSMVEIDTPVIFTTSFDEYAIKAFEVNSIDYLLKPIEPKMLERSLEKFDKHNRLEKQNVNLDGLLKMLNKDDKSYKTRFLVKTPKGLAAISINEIAYFYIENQLVFIKTRNSSRYLIDYKLDELDGMVNPAEFFRLSRQCIAHFDAIKEIHNYFNHALKIELKPTLDQEIIMSRYRVKSFKEWLNR